MVKNVGIGPADGFECMGKFGDTLRQEREFRGITLDAITRVTKISNRHLVALEQEHFEVLPGGVFNKSMVREYARVVGLDQEEWVGRYLSAHQSTKDVDEDGWMRFAENASKARSDSGRRSRPDQRLRPHRRLTPRPFPAPRSHRRTRRPWNRPPPGARSGPPPCPSLSVNNPAGRRRTTPSVRPRRTTWHWGSMHTD